MKRAVILAAFFVLVCPGLARAQETTGAIVGTVTSQHGALLPGVTVTLDDPVTGLQRSTATDPSGRYKFVALPPAEYALQASLDGFRTYTGTIEVVAGRTARADFRMALGAFPGGIDFGCRLLPVDVTTTVAGLTVNTDDLNDRIPVGREATQIALLAPTTVSSDTAFNGSNGYTPGQNVASISGASAGENLYVLNGLNITNFRNFVGSSFVPLEFLEELQVKTGGSDAGVGRTMGGVINMVTKSGTNALHGGANIYWKPESLQEQNDDALHRQNQDEFGESLEANVSLGGAFVRDKLFFFAFVRYDDSEYSEIFGGRETVYRNQAPYYGAKLDWNLTPNHRLEGTYLSDRTDFEGDRYVWNTEDRRREGYISTAINRRGGSTWILKYTGIITENFLLSGQYGVNPFDRSNGSNTDHCPYAWDSRGPTTPIGCWVNWQIVGGDDERSAYRIDLDWYLGTHSLRAGFDNEDLTSTERVTYSGGVRYFYMLNFEYPEIPQGADIVEIRDRWSGGSFDTTTTGIYAQDSWAISQALTLNYGLRWERYENFNAAGETIVTIDDQYTPRVGVIWDPSKRGRQKIYGSFGRYSMPIASNTNIRLGSVYSDVFEYWEVTGQDPSGLPFNPDGSPTGLGQLLERIQLADGEILDPSTLAASNIEPMSQLEYILGYEQMLGTDWSVGARFVMREYDAVIEDFTIDQALAEVYGVEGSFFNYVLGNPGSSYEGFFDLDGDGVNDPISFTAEELAYPEARRDYYAVELTANKRFSNNWLLQASYVWSQVYGNYEGYLNSDLGDDSAGITVDFDYAALMDHKSGFLPNDRRHNLKVFGAYAWDMGLQLGGFVNWRTGRPMNAIATHPTDFWAQLYGNASFFEQVTPGFEGLIPSPRGSQGTTDDVFALDAMARYDFQTGGINWNVRIDVFNLFNQQSNIEVHEFSGTDTLGVDAGFLETTHFQPARAVRLGFGMSF